MDAGIEGCLSSSFLDLLIDVLLSFVVHLFDTSGMDAPIGDEVLHRNACDLAAHRIVRRNSNALRGIVDDEIRSRDLLERTDVASFTTDDAALQVV